MRQCQFKIFIIVLLMPFCANGQKVVKIISNYVLIDADESSGLEIDDTIPVYRNEGGEQVEIGRIQIVRFNMGKCAGKIVSERGVNRIKIGDFIKLKGREDILSDEDFWGSQNGQDEKAGKEDELPFKTPGRAARDSESDDVDDWYEKYATNKKKRRTTDDSADEWGYSGKSGGEGVNRFDIGISASLNAAQHKIENEGFGGTYKSESELGSITGFNVGAVCNAQISQFNKLLIEIGYTQKDIDELFLNNLYLSNSLKFGNFNKNQSSVIPYFLTGADFFLKLKGKFDGNDDLTEYLNAIHWGIAFGAGIEIPMESTTVDINLKYLIGLSNLYKNDSFGDSFKFSSRINTITLMIGIYFNPNQ